MLLHQISIELFYLPGTIETTVTKTRKVPALIELPFWLGEKKDKRQINETEENKAGQRKIGSIVQEKVVIFYRVGDQGSPLW